MRKTGIIFFTVLLSALSIDACAETFAGVYMGYSSPHASTIMDTSGFGLPDDAHKLKPGFDAGMRAGYWFKEQTAPYFGLFMDISVDRTRIDTVWYPGIDIPKYSSLVMFSTTLNAALRYPYGKFRPYVGIGAGFIIADIDVSYSGFGSPYYTDGDTSASRQRFAGAEIGLIEAIYLFLEYRRVESSLEFKSDWKVKADYDTEQFLAGFGAKF